MSGLKARSSRNRLEKKLAIAVLALMPALFGAGGCADVRNVLLGKKVAPPDESKVAELPPLAVPPDFELRPPPEDTEDSRIEKDTRALKSGLLKGRGASADRFVEARERGGYYDGSPAGKAADGEDPYAQARLSGDIDALPDANAAPADGAIAPAGSNRAAAIGQPGYGASAYGAVLTPSGSYAQVGPYPAYGPSISAPVYPMQSYQAPLPMPVPPAGGDSAMTPSGSYAPTPSGGYAATPSGAYAVPAYQQPVSPQSDYRQPIYQQPVSPQGAYYGPQSAPLSQAASRTPIPVPAPAPGQSPAETALIVRAASAATSQPLPNCAHTVVDANGAARCVD